MNKKVITLISIVILLASLQLACSFSDILGSGGNDRPQAPPQESGEEGPQPPEQNDQEQSNQEESSLPPADQSSCTKAFTGSINLSEGQEFQSGDTFQVVFTLVNTGTCTWNSGYSLVQIGGDLSPSSSSLALAGDVATGDSVQLSVDYTAPAQPGQYPSVWKMKDEDGGIFGQNDPPNSPIRVIIRSVSSGNPQPTPNPTQQPQPTQQPDPDVSIRMNGVTMLDGECYDFNHGHTIDCNDSKADFRYSNSLMMGAKLFKANDNEFAEGQDQEPDKSSCETANFAPIPQTIYEGKYKCFKITSLASTAYGWIYIDSFDEEGLTFDFLMFTAGPPSVTVNTNFMVESQGQQITLMEGQCYDVWNGEKNLSCSGTFAGFLFEEVTKKSLQVPQINPNDLQFAAAMASEPSKSDCMNASYNTTPIWPIQETSYYCYQFVPGSTVYGWLRPTSTNLGGMTFDYLTWESSP